jgi:hypothetical protein
MALERLAEGEELGRTFSASTSVFPSKGANGPRDEPSCRQPTNAGPTDRLPFSSGVAVSDRRQLASAPSRQRHDPTVATCAIVATFCGNSRTRDRKPLIATSSASSERAATCSIFRSKYRALL